MHENCLCVFTSKSILNMYNLANEGLYEEFVRTLLYCLFGLDKCKIFERTQRQTPHHTTSRPIPSNPVPSSGIKYNEKTATVLM